ncbi:hypothetical protein BDZ91DRAFT_724385, partial [Kalaharituber pfeilii]
DNCFRHLSYLLSPLLRIPSHCLPNSLAESSFYCGSHPPLAWLTIPPNLGSAICHNPSSNSSSIQPRIAFLPVPPSILLPPALLLLFSLSV